MNEKAIIYFMFTPKKKKLKVELLNYKQIITRSIETHYGFVIQLNGFKTA